MGRPLVLRGAPTTSSSCPRSSQLIPFRPSANETSHAVWMDCRGLRARAAKHGLFRGIPFVRGCQRPSMPDRALEHGAAQGAQKLYEALVEALEGAARARRRVEVLNYVVLDAWDGTRASLSEERHSRFFLGAAKAAVGRVPVQEQPQQM